MKNFLKSNIKLFVGIFIGLFISCGIVYAANIGSASEVLYTPTDTTWNVSDVKSALDSLLSQLSTKLTERYNAGVTQGHTDRDTGVTVTAASQVLNGYKARTSSGTLVTGTDKGYTAGVTQGESNMKSGVTVTSESQIVSGYKARNASGTLLTGTATASPTYSESNPRVDLQQRINAGNIKWVGNLNPASKISLISTDTHCKVTGFTNFGGDSQFGIYVNGSLVANLDSSGNGSATFSNKSYIEVKSNGNNHTSGDFDVTYTIKIW